jgi:NADH-quinone oxidoreductase subunit K
MTLQISHYLVLSGVLFSIGAAGFLFRRNALVALMCIELMLNAVNLTLVAFNRYQDARVMTVRATRYDPQRDRGALAGAGAQANGDTANPSANADPASANANGEPRMVRMYMIPHHGQVFAFFVIAVAAAEAAVGLAIVLSLYRLRKTIRIDEANLLKR